MSAGRSQGAALRKPRLSPPARSQAAPREPSFDEILVTVSEAFDADFYRDAYADVAGGGMDPAMHYLLGGWREGRDPAPWFSTRAYLATHPSVAASGVNPFFHYLSVGRAKGWKPAPADWREELRRFRTGIVERVAATREKQPEPELSRAAVLREALAGIRAAHVTVSQDDFSRIVGGVQLCIDREAQALKGSRPHIHLFPAVRLPAVSDRANYAVCVLVDRRLVGTFAAADLAVLGEVLGPARRSTVAVHSLLGHHPETLADILAAARPRQAFFWVHDFAAGCVGYTLLHNDEAFCGGPPPGAEICRSCLYFPLRDRHIAAHTAFLQRLPAAVVAPSRTAAEIWSRTRDTAVEQVQIHPHAVVEGTPQPAPTAERPLKVAFAGLPLPHKGWPAFRALTEALAHDPRYEFHHFGEAPDLRARINFHRVAVSAARPAAMSEALAAAEVDIVVIWSICPETFCFTAREAAAAGAKLVAFADSGAAAAYAEEPGVGVVLHSEAALIDFFASKAAAELAGEARRPGRVALSGMSADLMARSRADG